VAENRAEARISTVAHVKYRGRVTFGGFQDRFADMIQNITTPWL
jgi:hypothetical protein